MSGSPSSNTIRFACTQCGTLLSYSADRAGQRVRCASCSTVQVVPQRKPDEPPPADDFDGYAIRDEELPARPAAALPPWLVDDEKPEKPGPKKRAADERPRPDNGAHADDTPPPTDGWGDWGAPVARATRPGEKRAESRSEKLGEVRGEKVGAADDDEADEPPYGAEQLDLVYGVWTMPWQGDAAIRWFMFTLGVFLTSWLTLWVIAMVVSDDMLTMVGGIVFVMPLIWLGLWTLSYGASCFLGILIDTANGARRVVNWPDPDWREWVFMLFQLAIPTVISLMIGWGLGMAADAAGIASPMVVIVATLLLFPVLLLSSLTEGSPIQVFSAPIWGSLGRLPLGWLLIYAAGALLVLPPVLLFMALGNLGYVVLIASSLWLAAAWFIYARLLGRLLCRIRYISGDLLEDDEEDA